MSQNLTFRNLDQQKQLKEKGYFILGDGTKSTDYEVPGTKKKAKNSDSVIKKMAAPTA